MKLGMILMVSIGFLGFASCNGGPAGNVDLLDTAGDAEYSKFPQDSLKQVLEDIYTHGEFQYLPQVCSFSEERNDKAPVAEFRCGEVLVGIVQGVERAQVVELLQTQVAGSIVKDRTDLVERPWVVAQVPIGSEKAAILALLSSHLTRYAALNFLGPAVLS